VNRLAPLVLAACALAVGIAAAIHYAHGGLTLSHYDARAHLVVARRIIDSLTPGWMQIGAVWLPLPHVMNMLPVQVDAWYRTGASAVVLSAIGMAAAVWALASFTVRTTGSIVAALAGAALLVLNPNVLYLQSTPMTEPLLFGFSLLAVSLTSSWLDAGADTWPTSAGLAAAAACLTRYEAWPITGALIVLTGAVLLRRGMNLSSSIIACVKLAAWPAAAILLFLANSRWTVGSWFVSGGFFVPENVEALGHPWAAWEQVRDGLYRLSGTIAVRSAYLGAALVTIAFARSRTRAPLLLVLALAAAGLLPWYAYIQGHPFRIRYDVPLTAACAATAGAAIGLLDRRLRPFVAAALVTAVLSQAPPLDRQAPLIAESQRDATNMAGREPVTSYLASHRDGRTILVSMGSLGHYIHDLSREGFAIHDFLHEGNGELWTFAMLRPSGIVGWILVEERAEGGDAIFQAARRNAQFLDGFTRVAQGGGVALYQRVP